MYVMIIILIIALINYGVYSFDIHDAQARLYPHYKRHLGIINNYKRGDNCRFRLGHCDPKFRVHE